MVSTLNIVIQPITKLKPHPLNATLYQAMDPESDQFLQLLASIREHGVLQPLSIRPDGTILSGHRRLAVAQHLELEHLPCVVVEGGDDRLLIVENNRYRHKTTSELMREAELIEKVVAEKALLNKSRAGAPRDSSVTEHIDTRETVAGAIGMGARTFSKLKKIYTAAKTNENAKEKMERIDRGDLSIDAAFKSLRTLMPEEDDPDAEAKPEIPDFIRFYNSWQFAENDPRFGIPHPGRIPGQISANIIYYYSEPGDLVVDPMAGGGSTLDAAEFLGRRVLGYDVVPKRPDIQQWDIAKGFPEETKGCQLIFMDPPYWNMMDEGYSDLSSSRKSLGDFKTWYYNLMAACSVTVKPGGFVAVINMGQYFRLPEDFEAGYIDWPVFAWNALHDNGMLPWSRIGVSYPTTLHTAYDVENAKAGKFFLPVLGDIIVMRRPK
jgi:ParB/RepB/Spo0J family partition protein